MKQPSVLPALMHPTQVARPFHTKGWIYEEKLDGWRMLALKDAGRVRLVSRNARWPGQSWMRQDRLVGEPPRMRVLYGVRS